jgi:hypothetical protein
MRMHIKRNVAALGLAALVVGGAAGTAFAASGGPSTAHTHRASVTAVQTASQSPALVKLTYSQLAAKLGVSTTALLRAIGDFKNTLGSVPGPKTSADLKTIMVKTLVPDLHISASSAEWAASELLSPTVLVTNS